MVFGQQQVVVGVGEIVAKVAVPFELACVEEKELAAVEAFADESPAAAFAAVIFAQFKRRLHAEDSPGAVCRVRFTGEYVWKAMEK